MSGKKWTEDEDALLRKYWQTPKKLVHLMDLFPGRTPDSMQDRALRLKLGRRKHVPRGGGSWKLIAKQLMTGPKTAVQIAEQIGMKRDKVLEILRKYKAKQRAVYVFAWTEVGRGGRSRIFALGNAMDAPRPKTMPRPQVQKNYIKRLKTERPDAYDVRMAKDKERKRREHRKPSADVASSWMFNPC